MAFRISPKSEILFGEHTSYQAGRKMMALRCSKVLSIYDQGVKEAGIVGPIIENMEKAGLKVVQFDKVLADPPDAMVNECGELARGEKVDGIVGIGGGSSLDTAKAVNVMLGNPGPIEGYLGPGIPHKPGKPLALIPTTAGTGSEVTHMAVITKTRNNAKDSLTGPATIASVAIVDPLLTLRLPPHITSATGMDTFAHALEAYTSDGRNTMSDMLAEKAIELVTTYLPKAVREGSDVEARTHMSFACLIAGMSFNDAIPHFGHAFGHTLGAMHHVPHGIGCAIGLPGVIEIAAGVLPNRVRKVGEFMGLRLSDSLSPAEVGKQVSDRMIAFNQEIGIPTLKELNVKESDLPRLATGTLGDGCFLFLPKKIGMQQVFSLIQKAYAV